MKKLSTLSPRQAQEVCNRNFRTPYIYILYTVQPERIDPTLTPLHLHHSSFYNPSAASPTSQFILQPFRCFTYAIGTSPTSQSILQPFRLFNYVTGYSTTLPLLHLRHRHFTYGTSPGEPPMHKGMKKQCVCRTSLLQQVTKFRSSYSFG